MTLVFVYGTLKDTFSNNVLLESSSKRLLHAITADKYFMSSSNPLGYGFPFAFSPPEGIDIDKGLYPIKGEVYQVTDKILQRLDRLEGHPVFYTRTRVKVMGFMTNTIFDSNVYMYVTNNSILRPDIFNHYDQLPDEKVSRGYWFWDKRVYLKEKANSSWSIEDRVVYPAP